LFFGFFFFPTRYSRPFLFSGFYLSASQVDVSAFEGVAGLRKMFFFLPSCFSASAQVFSGGFLSSALTSPFFPADDSLPRTARHRCRRPWFTLNRVFLRAGRPVPDTSFLDSGFLVAHCRLCFLKFVSSLPLFCCRSFAISFSPIHKVYLDARNLIWDSLTLLRLISDGDSFFHLSGKSSPVV